MVLTKETSKPALMHIIHKVFEHLLNGQVFASFAYEGITGIVEFVNLSLSDLDDFQCLLRVKSDDGNKDVEHVVPLPKKDLRLLKNVWKWSCWLYLQQSNREWELLTFEDYTVFIQEVAPKHISGAGTSSAFKAEVATFQSNIKLDVKSYPLHDGKTSTWLKFKRGVQAQATTHGLDIILDLDKPAPPLGSQDRELFDAKNKFVFSIWTSRVSGESLTILREFEATQDGRAVWERFLQKFESVHNLEQVALQALKRLEDLAHNSWW